MSFIKSLGKGSFGEVVLFESKNEYFAVKCIPKNKYTNREIINHALLANHSNIINFKSVSYTDEYICIVMEYAENGDLLSYIKKHKYLNECMSKYFLKQLIKAVEYCHKNDIAHCDIKLDNLLLDKNYILKLADFGYSRNISGDIKPISGTLHYMSPELIINKTIDDIRIDIYACGICLYIMLHGKYPFKLGNQEETIKSILSTKYEIKSGLTSVCVDLLDKMLEFDKDKRISINDIKNHPWLNIDQECDQCTFLDSKNLINNPYKKHKQNVPC
jgi:serine/threonine-protein kinase SRK2